MKIVVIVHYFAPHIGGMEEVAKKQAESLVRAGHEVTVVTCRPDNKSPLYEEKDGYKIMRIPAWNIVENKFGVTFPIVSPLAVLTMMKFARWADLVHIHDVFYMSSHMATFGALIARKPIYVTQHVAMVDHPSPLVMAVQRMIYSTLGRLIFKKARKIICYNTNVRDFLERESVPSKNILLHYNGIDVDYFSPVSAAKKASLKKQYGLDPKRPVALFVGRLVPKKGYDIVFDARSPKYQTLIVGTGEVPAHMKNVADVIFYGAADHAQLRELYRLSDVFVFPAVGEILTLVMQEAMATGLPVITTNDPAYKGYDIDAGRVMFVKRHASDLKKAIESIVANPKTGQQMGDYSRQIAEERFSWKKNFGEELAVYTERKTS